MSPDQMIISNLFKYFREPSLPLNHGHAPYTE